MKIDLTQVPTEVLKKFEFNVDGRCVAAADDCNNGCPFKAVDPSKDCGGYTHRKFNKKEAIEEELKRREHSRSDFRVGDIVYDVRHGEGTVTKVEKSSTYPVMVKFGNNVRITYTIDGRPLVNVPRTLFFTEPRIIPGATSVPEDKVVELSIEEIAEKFGVSTESIRIKE